MSTHANGGYHEQVLQIGNPIPLNGVMTQGATLDTTKPLVLLLNSGLMHHVGSCSISVKLARALAAHNITSVRFDFSAIGDSLPRPNNESIPVRSQQEVVEVMDYLQQQFGFNRFLCQGLCSGAYASMTACLSDERIVGIAQFAGYAFRTPKWYLTHISKKYLNTDFWVRQLGKVRRIKETKATPTTNEMEQFDADQVVQVTKAELEAIYAKLISRKVHTMLLMTRGEIDFYNYEGQLADLFPALDLSGLLEEYLFADTRHIITEPDDQAAIVNLTVNWMAKVCSL